MQRIKRFIASLLCVPFLMGMVVPSSIAAEVVSLMPKPGTMVGLSQPFVPAMLKGMKVYPQDPLRFDFVIDTGNSKLSQDELQKESSRFVRYFLASLTVPENDLWVNLSPYENDRIIPENFGLTEMGRDLLAQDYILKQLTSSLMYPEDALGASVWKKIYALAFEKYGTTDIPFDTFNKVWIMPDEATVYVNGNTALIASTHLKVMLDTDYLAMKENREKSEDQDPGAEVRSLSEKVIREVVLPQIEQEVNTGNNFSTLRQIYHAMVLSTWFKRNMKKSLVGQLYTDRNKVAGIDMVEKEVKDRIWQQYVEAFKKGAFNYIKEEMDEGTQEVLPRKYFAGGFVEYAQAVTEKEKTSMEMAQASGVVVTGSPEVAVVRLKEVQDKEEEVARHITQIAKEIGAEYDESSGRYLILEAVNKAAGKHIDLISSDEKNKGKKTGYLEIRGGVLVVVDERFTRGHAGRGAYQLAVYAADEQTVKHELAELNDWLEFVVEFEDIEFTQADLDDLKKGKRPVQGLGRLLWNYANTGTPKERLDKQNILRRQYKKAHKAGLSAEIKYMEKDNKSQAEIGDKKKELDEYMLEDLEKAQENFDFFIASDGSVEISLSNIEDWEGVIWGSTYDRTKISHLINKEFAHFDLGDLDDLIQRARDVLLKIESLKKHENKEKTRVLEVDEYRVRHKIEAVEAARDIAVSYEGKDLSFIIEDLEERLRMDYPIERYCQMLWAGILRALDQPVIFRPLSAPVSRPVLPQP